MSISAIKDSVVSGLSKAGHAVVNATVWLGHKISVGFNNYLVPAISKVWSLIKSGFSYTVSFFRTGPGLATLGFSAGAGLIALSFSKNFEGNVAARAGLIALGSLAIVGGGIAVGLTIARGPGALI